MEVFGFDAYWVLFFKHLIPSCKHIYSFYVEGLAELVLNVKIAYNSYAQLEKLN